MHSRRAKVHVKVHEKVGVEQDSLAIQSQVGKVRKRVCVQRRGRRVRVSQCFRLAGAGLLQRLDDPLEPVGHHVHQVKLAGRGRVVQVNEPGDQIDDDRPLEELVAVCHDQLGQEHCGKGRHGVHVGGYSYQGGPNLRVVDQCANDGDSGRGRRGSRV